MTTIPEGYRVNCEHPEYKKSLMPPEDYLIEVVTSERGFPFSQWQVNPKYLVKK